MMILLSINWNDIYIITGINFKEKLDTKKQFI